MINLSILYYTLYALSILGIFIVSALVYSKGKKDEYRYFSIFATFLNVWLMSQFFAQLFADSFSIDSTVLLRITTAIGPFFALYFYFFAARYTGASVHKKRHFVAPSVIALLSILTNWVLVDAEASFSGIVIHDGPLYYVVFLLIVAYTVAAMMYLLREIRSKNLTASRRQADIIFIFAVLQALVIVSIVSLFFSDEPLSQVLVPFSLFVMVVIFGYAIVRHKLFDIRLAAVRALTYSFSLATLGLIYSFVAFVLVNLILGGGGDVSHQVFYLVIALGLALTFTPLKSFFDRLTRSFFYQDSYEPQKVIDEFSNLLVSTVDIDKVSKHAAQILRDAMKSQYIALLFPSEKGNKKSNYRMVVVGDGGILKHVDFDELFETKTAKAFTRDDLEGNNVKLLRFMQSIECGAAARLEAHDDVIGYILFGEKNNARHYTHHDIELIHITADELALGIQNALRFEEIQMFNRTLQEKIEDATLKLRHTNTELRRLDEAKDEFVSMASHQLRTPLTSVKGYISMVLEGDVGKITNMQRQLLGEAFTSSERMVHLINDFLNVSRLQTGKFMIEAKPIDLSKVVSQEVDSLQTTANARGLKIEYHAPTVFPILYIDEGKIRQVIMNFIDNAIYYSSEETSIHVELRTEGGEAILKVKDTGIGVPKAEQAHLFTKFFRATNARKQRPDGTGVGLFLAKKVIVAHGGTILFESTEGEGSTFGFRLPIKKLSAAHDTDELEK